MRFRFAPLALLALLAALSASAQDWRASSGSAVDAGYVVERFMPYTASHTANNCLTYTRSASTATCTSNSALLPIAMPTLLSRIDVVIPRTAGTAYGSGLSCDLKVYKRSPAGADTLLAEIDVGKASPAQLKSLGDAYSATLSAPIDAGWELKVQLATDDENDCTNGAGCACTTAVTYVELRLNLLR